MSSDPPLNDETRETSRHTLSMNTPERHSHLAQIVSTTANAPGTKLIMKPRIRDITGIRIHQLTLPDALSYASKLVPSPSLPTSATDIALAGPSSPRLRRAASHTEPSRRQRRISTSTLPDESVNALARSVSASLAPASPIHRAPRTTRPRAPTLAGEAIELALDSSSVLERFDEEAAPTPTRKLVRCFVTLKLPPPSRPRPNGNKESGPNIASPRLRNSSTNSSPTTSPPHTPRSGSCQDKLKPTHTPTRQRTTSLSTVPASPRDPARRLGGTATADVPLSRTISDKARSRTQTGPQVNGTRPTLTLRRSGSSTHSISRSLLSPTLHEEPPTVPFFISPMHKPSTHPRFVNLSEDDLAPWLTVEEAASTRLILEVWYDEPEEGGWKVVSGVGGEVDMALLRRVEGSEGREINSVQLTFAWDTPGVYYLPPVFDKDGSRVDGAETSATPGRKQKQTVKGVVERSMRETRMKKGVGVGALHQLVNMQSVLVDTKRDVEGVQRKIDRLLAEDADYRAIRRDIAEREEQCRWILEKIDEVSKTTREVQAHVTLREQALEERTNQLEQARAHAELMHGHASEMTNKVDTVDSERSSLVDLINHYRMNHVQTLDSVFPIAPLHPPTLLYSILGVPLPIPAGPKDPAPPLSLAPGALPDGVGKIDEKTTAAALGYVAMVVQILSNLGGAVGGVPYPVTCAGSRSLVKDVVSVMQGPRSFPLYAKGVERYRYEYAVFLLNKNIETLMQEANIRLVDLRHTLPNLKTLLLTLSSPVPTTSLSSLSSFPGLSRSSTFVDSRASSRQTSAAYPRPWASPRSVGSSNGEPSPSKLVGTVGSLGLGSPSPAKRSGLRRSLLSGDVGRADDEKSVGSVDELESVSAA